MTKISTTVAFVAAILFVLSGPAYSAKFAVTLTDVNSGSLNGTLGGNLSGGLTGTFDDGTGIVTMDGTTMVQFEINPVTSLFTHVHTNWLTGSNSYAATAYSCIEGSFGQAVAANLCGGYNFGADFIEDSSVDYSTIPGTLTIGGDDVIVVPQQQGWTTPRLSLSSTAPA